MEATTVKLGGADLQTMLDAKQGKLVIGPLPIGGAKLFDLDPVCFRAIQVSAPLSVAPTGNSHITINSDTYSKQRIENKIGTISGAISVSSTLSAANVTASGSLSAPYIDTVGTPGLKFRGVGGNIIAKFSGGGTPEFYNNAQVDGNLAVIGSLTMTGAITGALSGDATTASTLRT